MMSRISPSRRIIIQINSSQSFFLFDDAYLISTLFSEEEKTRLRVLVKICLAKSTIKKSFLFVCIQRFLLPEGKMERKWKSKAAHRNWVRVEDKKTHNVISILSLLWTFLSFVVFLYLHRNMARFEHTQSSRKINQSPCIRLYCASVECFLSHCIY